MVWAFFRMNFIACFPYEFRLGLDCMGRFLLVMVHLL
ncbi:MAG: hypothetical protein ACFFCW_34830 [Candidatus Hodarchaeota archaeon]